MRAYAKERGYPYADRLVLHGANDVGDIRLGDGIPVAIEVKGGQKAVSGIPAHVREMLVETANAKAETGVVIAKKARSDKVDEWFAVLTVGQWFDLIERLYPPPATKSEYDNGHDHDPHPVRPRLRIRGHG